MQWDIIIMNSQKYNYGTNKLEIKAGITDPTQLKMEWYDLRF